MHHRHGVGGLHLLHQDASLLREVAALFAARGTSLVEGHLPPQTTTIARLLNKEVLASGEGADGDVLRIRAQPACSHELVVALHLLSVRRLRGAEQRAGWRGQHRSGDGLIQSGAM